MPSRPRQPCKSPGCANPARSGRSTCTECRTRTNRDQGTRRGNPDRRGYGRGHRDRFRIGVLTRDRLCRVCKRKEAVVADHHPLDRKTLLKMGLDADSPEHGRGLCIPCHNRATALTPGQQGGWYRGGQG